MSRRLPRGMERFLALVVPGDILESIAGDLEEDYARSGPGGWRAAVGIWWQAARIAVSFGCEAALRERHLPPIADEAPRRLRFGEALTQDVTFGVRLLRRQPAFTVMAVTTLALGIGACTAMFGLVDAVLWRRLPFPDATAIVSLVEQRPTEGRSAGLVAPADFVDWRARSHSFTAMAATSPFALNLTGAGEPERLDALAASPGFLRVLAVTPVLGRGFAASEEAPDRSHVAILSNAVWRVRFGADPHIVGRRVLLNAVPHEIVGVLPADFWWPTHPAVLVPLALSAADRELRFLHEFDVFARLKGGVSPEQAAADMRVIGNALAEEYPEANARHFPRVRPVRDALVGHAERALLVLLGAVGLVLLIACANVATLLTARGAARRRELAVRVALGAGRARLVRQLLTESLLLAGLGGGVGVLVAAWAVPALRVVVSTRLANLPGLDRVAVDGRVLAAALVLTCATSLLFGLLPAFASAHDAPRSALNEEGRSGTTGISARRGQAMLVVAEVALSIVLLVGAGLLLASFRHLIEESPGFRADHLVTMRVTLPQARYGDHHRIVAFYQSLLDRIGSMPAVQAAGVVNILPFSGADSRSGFLIAGRAEESPFPTRAHPRSVSAGYLAAMQVPLLRGRDLTDRDGEGTPAVVVINEAAARRYWPGADPIGRRISFAFDTPVWLQIVGVVGNVKHSGLDVDAEPEAYLPYLQTSYDPETRAMSVVVRTSGSLEAVSATLRAAVRELDKDQPVGVVRPMDDLLSDSMAPRRLNLLLVGAFAIAALALTGAGLYGVMAYVVAQRTREIGIRMALGATGASVLALVLRQAGAMTLAGIAVGLAGALALTRVLSGLLFGVSRTDPAVYAAVSLLLAFVALLAAAVPCRRAMRVEPVAAMRD